MSTGAAQAIGVAEGTTTRGPETQDPALIGATLEGAYRIDRLIAEGGMSAVYEAVQLRLRQRVAVKVMAQGLASNPEALARFRREAEITSRLRHPHLVTVMDFGTAPGGQPYLVMEYLEGIDLELRIRKHGALPLPTVVHVAKQVASALAAAHEQGIVHRDLKPANIFLVELPGEPDFAKVLDFGISKVRAASTQLTKASSIIGTPNYMAPEQATGMVDEIDHRTDQWALACIVWEMLCGRAPFASDDMSAVFYQIIHLEPRSLRQRVPDLPPAVETVLLRALSKNMANRFPSVRDFAGALENAAAGRPLATAAAASRGPATEPGESARVWVERRRSGRERRRAEPSVSLAHAASSSSRHRLTATARVPSGRKLKMLYAGLFAAGFVLVVALVPSQWTDPARAAPAPVVPAAAVTSPHLPPPAAATPPAGEPAPAGPLEAPVKSPARAPKPRLPGAGPLDGADPFEARGRLTRSPATKVRRASDAAAAPVVPARAHGKPKTPRAGRDGPGDIDPFAP